MNLDDIKALSKVDRSRSLEVMEKTPERLTPPPDAASTCGARIERPSNIVFGGVGGSGIIGDIVSDYLRSVGDVPVSVCRSVRLPAYVGKGTLFVAISYSGETPETLSLLDQALRKGALAVTVGSGGKLLDKSRREGIGYLKVPEGLLPRLALPELLAAVGFVMGRAGLIKGIEKLLWDSAETLRAQIREIGTNAPLQENKAKLTAQALLDRLPLLFGSEDTGSVLRRFKNELNENSKMPAFYYTLPEGYHDDVEGLKMLSKLARTQPIVLRDQDENLGQRRARERLYGLFVELGFQTVLEFEGLGKNMLQRLLSAVMFGDYVSAYLAVLREVDPSELTLIPRFREAMRGN
jgi:glucose/mannose-6-phosphate isomerase